VYDGSDAPGWIHSVAAGDGGTSIYTSPSKELKNVQIAFSTSRKGSLYFHIFGAREKPTFLQGKIVIDYRDRGKRVEIPATDEITIDVGESQDFTVIVPSFRVETGVLPELNARFHWSDRTGYFIQK
jgi:hypothetical protein